MSAGSVVLGGCGAAGAGELRCRGTLSGEAVESCSAASSTKPLDRVVGAIRIALLIPVDRDLGTAERDLAGGRRAAGGGEEDEEERVKGGREREGERIGNKIFHIHIRLQYNLFIGLRSPTTRKPRLLAGIRKLHVNNYWAVSAGLATSRPTLGQAWPPGGLR
jgi:hypothetical protein